MTVLMCTRVSITISAAVRCKPAHTCTCGTCVSIRSYFLVLTARSDTYFVYNTCPDAQHRSYFTVNLAGQRMTFLMDPMLIATFFRAPDSEITFRCVSPACLLLP